MEIRTYYEDYLEHAQKNLGHMFDYAINTLEFDADVFMDMFLVSGIAKQFGRGNPTYVAGKTGCELAKEVIKSVGLDNLDREEIMYLDRSPEYWAGWALCFYQWYTGKTFQRIQKAVPLSRIIGMYPVMHEADVMKFVTNMDELLKDFYVDTNLKHFRTLMQMTQSELANESGVALRQIQLLEQRQRDINKAKAETVLRLARVLVCEMEDLME